MYVHAMRGLAVSAQRLLSATDTVESGTAVLPWASLLLSMVRRRLPVRRGRTAVCVTHATH